MISKMNSNGMEFLTVTNNKNLKIIFNNLGASIYCIYFDDVIMTPQVKNERDFLNEDVRFGKNIGRVAGRIPNHTLVIDGKSYNLSCNERTNTLHGGHDGIATKFFNSIVETEAEFINIKYTYLSKDGESGFPGDAFIKITYKVSKNSNDIKIIFNVTTTKTCPISLTTHTFFNLGDENLDGLYLFVNSKKYVKASYETLVQEETLSIPDCLNFNKSRKLIETINDPLLNKGILAGYDHYLLLEETDKPQIVLENSRYKLEINTDYNSSVFYSDNFVDSYKLNNSFRSQRRGLAIEPQISCMDNLLLQPNKEYNKYIKYSFSKKE